MARYKRLLMSAGLLFVLTLLPVTTFASDMSSGEESPVRTLSLQDVLKRITTSPTLQAAAKNIEIRDGLSEQASLLPNPDIAIEVENFGGEDALKGLDSAETTIAISQLLELGGKRTARKGIAKQEMNLAEWDFQIRSQDLRLETMKAFYALLSVQERLSQATQLAALAKQTYRTVADRVEAGKVSPVQELRARIELNLAKIAGKTLQRQLIQARQDLSSLWGDPEPDFDVAIGSFESLGEPPTWEELQVALLNTPEVKRWEAELARNNSSLDLARANSIPDVTLSFGLRNYQETNSNAFVAGMEIPLSIFDRNQGGRMAAQSEVSQSIYLRDAAIAKLASDLQSNYQELMATYLQALTIKQDVMPLAEQANEAAQIGYQEGKFNFLDALDAQRTLFDVKAQYVDAFSAYHEARLNVMRMAGRLNDVSTD
jgi:cobalt-zinc-cadmium efflux system outer membrane protein